MKPNDIPKDVWDAANAYAVPAAETATRNLNYDDVSIEVQAIFFAIARAILAERERCAKVAEKHASPGQMWERDEMPTAKLAAGYAARDIAAAIRKGAE